MVKKLEGAGLRGKLLGKPHSVLLDKLKALLTGATRLKRLQKKQTFEEVAHLLLYGKLPTQSELDNYKALLKSKRDLPQTLKDVLQKIPASAHPMDVMRTGTSMLGNLEPEGDLQIN